MLAATTSFHTVSNFAIIRSNTVQQYRAWVTAGVIGGSELEYR